MATSITSFLAGWKRRNTVHGMVLTMQLLEEGVDTELGRVTLVLGDAQLCSLARDLDRAARARGLEVWPKQKLRIFSLIDQLLTRATAKHVPALLLTDNRPRFG